MISCMVRSRTWKDAVREAMAEEEKVAIVDGNGNTVRVINTDAMGSVIQAMKKAAKKGNVRAAEFLRNTMGEMPVQQLQIQEVDFSALDAVQYGDDTHGN